MGFLLLFVNDVLRQSPQSVLKLGMTGITIRNSPIRSTVVLMLVVIINSELLANVDRENVLIGEHGCGGNKRYLNANVPCRPKGLDPAPRRAIFCAQT